MSSIQLTYSSLFTDNFDYPFKTCVVGDNLYVCDRQNNVIKYYSIAIDGTLSFIGSFGNSELILPEDITTDGTCLYVCDVGNNRCVVYDLNGSLQTTFTVGAYAQIKAITCDGTNLYFIYLNTVVKTDLLGTEILNFGGSSVFNFPLGIDWNNGNLYIADTYNTKIDKYTDTGTFIARKYDITLSRPAGIAVIGDFVCVSDLVNARLVFLEKDSLNVSTTIGSFGSGNENFNFPVGVSATDDFIYISDAGNNRISTYSYDISTEIDYANDFVSSIKSLFPTGLFWSLNETSFIYKLFVGIGTFFSRAFSSIKEINGWMLPDNKLFSQSALEAWEVVFGIPINDSKSFDERYATISQRMSFPGEILARQSAVYIQNELQLSGFDVYVTYNRFPASEVEPEMGSEYLEMDSVYSEMNGSESSPNRFERREPEAGYTELIANYLNPDLDANIFDAEISMDMDSDDSEMNSGNSEMSNFVDVNREVQLRGTFFVHGATYPNLADIPAYRQDEFRELILKLKPAQLVGFLYINWL